MVTWRAHRRAGRCGLAPVTLTATRPATTNTNRAQEVFRNRAFHHSSSSSLPPFGIKELAVLKHGNEHGGETVGESPEGTCVAVTACA